MKSDNDSLGVDGSSERATGMLFIALLIDEDVRETRYNGQAYSKKSSSAVVRTARRMEANPRMRMETVVTNRAPAARRLLGRWTVKRLAEMNRIADEPWPNACFRKSRQQ